MVWVRAVTTTPSSASATPAACSLSACWPPQPLRPPRHRRPHTQIPRSRWGRALLAQQPDATIARLLGVSRVTIYRYVPELKTGQRPQLEPGTPTAHVELPTG
nr:hypothetical protein GCM10010200_100380 [Actinomadura rugatobispora]